MKTAITRLNLEPYMPPLLISAAIYDINVAKSYGPHAWHVYELHYFHSGEAGWTLDDGLTMRVTGGHCSLVQPMTRHRMADDVMSPCKNMSLLVKPNPPASCPPFSQPEVALLYDTLRQAGNRVAQARPEVDGVFCALRDELARLGDQPPTPLQAVSIRMQFAHLLVSLIQSFAASTSSPHYPAVARAKRFIEQHLDEELKIADLARAARLKPTRFHALFLAETGMTPADYRLRHRLARAQHQLRDSSRTITEIAHSLGFSSSSCFTIAFRKHLAITPTAYRLQAQRVREREGVCATPWRLSDPRRRQSV